MSIEQQSLANYILKTIPVSGSIAGTMAAHFELVEFDKNDLLLKQGQISNDYLFLETGFIRTYTYNTDGGEATTNIYSKNSIVFEAASYIKRTPTKENMQALTNCTAQTIKHDAFQILFHSIPEFREFGRANLLNGFIALKERTLAMINLTAEQRYEQLLYTRPEIFQYVPLKYIASYLGVTDTSLSRIRKERMQK